MRRETRTSDTAMAARSPLQFRIVWSVGEGFGRPYVPGTSTDVGAAIVYSLVFLALLLVDAGRFSVDRWIVRKLPAWRPPTEAHTLRHQHENSGVVGP